MKLDEDEIRLFDAILAGVATARPFDGQDETLAADAERRALRFVALRRRQIPSTGEGEPS